MISINEDKYDDEWKNNLKEGKKIIYWNNGDKYDGEQKNCLIEGKGKYYFIMEINIMVNRKIV